MRRRPGFPSVSAGGLCSGHSGWTWGEAGEAPLAVTIQECPAAERLEVFARCFGLTPRQRSLLEPGRQRTGHGRYGGCPRHQPLHRAGPVQSGLCRVRGPEQERPAGPGARDGTRRGRSAPGERTGAADCLAAGKRRQHVHHVVRPKDTDRSRTATSFSRKLLRERSRASGGVPAGGTGRSTSSTALSRSPPWSRRGAQSVPLPLLPRRARQRSNVRSSFQPPMALMLRSGWTKSGASKTDVVHAVGLGLDPHGVLPAFGQFLVRGALAQQPQEVELPRGRTGSS